VAGKRGRYRWLSPVERRVAVERFWAGGSPGEVVAEFGVSHSTACVIRDEAALMRRRVGCSGRRLSFEERERISRGIATGESGREIARALGRCPSTVSREINACGGRERYRALRAHARAQRCARRPKQSKLAGCPELMAEVEAGLLKGWSPEQISARLCLEFPDDPRMRISHETIYLSLFVQSRGELRRQLCAQLRTRRTTRRQAGRQEQRGRIPGMVSISERPAEAADRAVPGHWEGDLILGSRGRSAVVTLVERQTRFVMLGYLGGEHTTERVTEALGRRIAGLPEHLMRSLTWDQGRELTAHQQFTIENTNGLLRQYLPKGSDLAVHDQQALDEIARLLNGRPRKTLAWRNPAEKMAELLAADPTAKDNA
jgi:transposase, IS30 family